MNRLRLLINRLPFFVPLALAACAPGKAERARWEREAQNVTITRDDWGIAHVHGKSDADAVFGMVYAQAEDDFNRVEMNYINAMGRLAETEGESAVFQDLRMKLFIDPADLQREYTESPAWLRTLMDAWADGLNYYLHNHPEVTPKVITRFEPWMALSFTEGSIGGDIERVNVRQLQIFYTKHLDERPTTMEPTAPAEPTGSNGIAIAPANTVDHHALLLINPHTSFFFRSELQMTSDEGLDAYGAVTWGQFFVYQGFNAHAGWMHTSSGVDNIDEYLETVVRHGDSVFYRYGDALKPMLVKQVTVPYKTDSGMVQRPFTVYRTEHGPIVRVADDHWVSVALMQDPVHALIQSYSRTKVKNYQEFRQTMELHTNSSNNTIFADAEGNIAYFHSDFIPRRSTQFDWTQPVDGSDTATAWRGVLSLDETPSLLNPGTGWLYNSNNWPWSAAGPASPKREDFPAYVETGTSESARGLHALRVLSGRKDFTVTSLRDAAFDSYLPAFEEMIPPLIKAYDRTPSSNPLKRKLVEQVTVLRNWDFRWSVSSVATSLAVFWGEEFGRRAARERARSALEAGRAGMQMTLESLGVTASKAPAQMLLETLAAASDKLAADFGTWKTPWGDINRFQRLTGDIVQPFADSGPSIPVGFTSSRWGSLASFGARAYPGTKKWYGTSGNSFVAVVEFGDSVRAIAITAGGESGDPKSPHFNDEVERYATGDLRPVYFYPAQLEGHTEREYHPGG
jgi:acyl-homoserine-lactone acylase